MIIYGDHRTTPVRKRRKKGATAIRMPKDSTNESIGRRGAGFVVKYLVTKAGPDFLARLITPTSYDLTPNPGGLRR